MILIAILILIVIVFALVYFYVLRNEPNAFMQGVAAVIAAVVSLVAVFAGFMIPFVLFMATRYFYPAAIPADDWLQILYVSLVTAAGLLLYELSPQKMFIAVFRAKKWNPSLLLVIKAIATFVMINLAAGWLGHSDWNTSALIIIAVLNTLIEYGIDKATKSADY